MDYDQDDDLERRVSAAARRRRARLAVDPDEVPWLTGAGGGARSFGEVAVIPPPPAWHRDAACLGMPVGVFFPEGQGRGKRPDVSLALETCAGCPVRSECLTWALEEVDGTGVGALYRFGIFGGLTPAGRADEAARRAEGTPDRERRSAAA